MEFDDNRDRLKGKLTAKTERCFKHLSEGYLLPAVELIKQTLLKAKFRAMVLEDAMTVLDLLWEFAAMSSSKLSCKMVGLESSILDLTKKIVEEVQA